MAKYIIVRLKSHSTSRMFWIAIVCCLSQILVTKWSGFWSALLDQSIWENDMQQGHGLLSPATAIGFSSAATFVVTWLYTTRTPRKDPTFHGVAVVIYAIGVQFADVLMNESKSSQSIVQTNPRTFLPRDQIIDCIVTEHILAHKVQNLVMLRVRTGAASGVSETHSTVQSSDESGTESNTDPMSNVQLVDAFPNVELTYMECLALRAKIMEELFIQ